MVLQKKTENFEKVRDFVHSLDKKTVTNYEIQQELGFNYLQANKYLKSLVEINELKYSETSKIYVRVD